MTANQLLQRQVEYHLWALDATIASLEKAQNPPSGAVSLTAHVLMADRIWMDRIRGADASDARAVEEESVPQLREAFEQHKQLWAGFSREIEGLGADEAVSFQQRRGGEATAALGDIIMHLVHHAAYHRGQIARAMREAGCKPARTDFILFALR